MGLTGEKPLARFGNFSPLERVLLTANGNLQRIISAYYDAQVSVEVVKCDRVVSDAVRGVSASTTFPTLATTTATTTTASDATTATPATPVAATTAAPSAAVAAAHTPTAVVATFDRKVRLLVGGTVFGTAESDVQLHTRAAEEAVSSGTIGIGQLFRHLDILPQFTLLDAGKHRDGRFWRRYKLASSVVSCTIHEQFDADVFTKVIGSPSVARDATVAPAAGGDEQ
jgi:hypothetical protein